MTSIVKAIGLGPGLGCSILAAGAGAAAPNEPRKITVSKAASKPIAELQSAVNANDVAAIPAKLAAARAAAQSPDDHYLVAQLQLKAAVAANDELAVAAAIDAMLASGAVAPADTGPLYLQLGKLGYKHRQYARAASALERGLAHDPGNAEAIVLLAETRNSLGQPGDAVALLQRAVRTVTASGQKAQESWYRRAIALAYNAKLPGVVELSRQWVAAYPTPANWRDALAVYRSAAGPDEESTLDSLRLARATGALSEELDVYNFAIAAAAATPGEARAAIDEAAEAKRVDPSRPPLKEVVEALEANRAMSREALPELAREAMAASAARLAVRTADAYYGYGDYAQAAELYRAALSKSGVDSNRANLRLGMALARAGDTAGATAALNAVSGPLAELAKFWLVYVATRSS